MLNERNSERIKGGGTREGERKEGSKSRGVRGEEREGKIRREELIEAGRRELVNKRREREK